MTIKLINYGTGLLIALPCTSLLQKTLTMSIFGYKVYFGLFPMNHVHVHVRTWVTRVIWLNISSSCIWNMDTVMCLAEHVWLPLALKYLFPSPSLPSFLQGMKLMMLSCWRLPWRMMRNQRTTLWLLYNFTCSSPELSHNTLNMYPHDIIPHLAMTYVCDVLNLCSTKL